MVWNQISLFEEWVCNEGLTGGRSPVRTWAGFVGICNRDVCFLKFICVLHENLIKSVNFPILMDITENSEHKGIMYEKDE